jgi:post-segregation antitoxin (ccd killing protein)
MATKQKLKTTLWIDEKIKALAKKHDINLSATARRAIMQKIEQCEAAERSLQNE